MALKRIQKTTDAPLNPKDKTQTEAARKINRRTEQKDPEKKDQQNNRIIRRQRPAEEKNKDPSRKKPFPSTGGNHAEAAAAPFGFADKARAQEMTTAPKGEQTRSLPYPPKGANPLPLPLLWGESQPGSPPSPGSSPEKISGEVRSGEDNRRAAAK